MGFMTPEIIGHWPGHMVPFQHDINTHGDVHIAFHAFLWYLQRYKLVEKPWPRIYDMGWGLGLFE